MNAGRRRGAGFPGFRIPILGADLWASAPKGTAKLLSEAPTRTERRETPVCPQRPRPPKGVNLPRSPAGP